MTINLLRYKDDLLNSYQTILESENEDNWVIFSYDGSSNALKTDCSGSGGIDDLRENLNGGKLLYGLIKIRDPGTKLLKLILIHWQGEAVPSIRLGQYASHIHEVKKFFKGVSLTHYARNEDDVDRESILKSFRTANYGANTIIAEDISKQAIKCDSVYEKVDLKKDMQINHRDQFWASAEQEEVRRVEEEKRRLIADRKKKEEEQKKLLEKFHQHSEQDDMKQRHQMVTSEVMRRERLQEISEVVPSRSGLKTMWEEKTKPQPEMKPSSVKKSIPTPRKEFPIKYDNPANGTVPEKINYDVNKSGTNGATIPVLPQKLIENGGSTMNYEDDKRESVNNFPMNGKNNFPTNGKNEQIEPIKLQSDFKKMIVSQVPQIETAEDDENEWEDDHYHDKSDHVMKNEESKVEQYVDKVEAIEKLDVGLRAQALWDYQASDETEVSFNPGEIITQIECIDEGWWRGRAPDGTVGLFPANYVELLQ